MPHRIAVLAFEEMSPFHLSVPTIVFGSELTGSIPMDYDVTVCGLTAGPLRTKAGFDIAVHHDLSAFDGADTVVIPSWDRDRPVPPALSLAVRTAHARGARIVGLCVGAFVVAASGIVDGRTVTTHWHAAAQLAAAYPAVQVRSDVLWTDLGDVVTSAGTVAALDCCLHLVRSDHGAAPAAQLAKRLVMAPHRGGSQAQHIELPVVPADLRDDIAEAMSWARLRLDEPVDLDRWAAAVALSRRTFTRRFRERTGVSPGQWLLTQRLDHARGLLETTDLAIDTVAERSGFGSAVSLRRHFRDELGTSPRRHREQFALRAG
ncbi:GlxA family transcriptional regulator [Nakamurella lactea]|uniref:GlxA family transcriptional regulator n=1 Tax=Nakamurella lactea TaxID=459515 RepID=UPI00048FA4D1|nr:helix-turn-helix domain-containing protein [Nakamurella lactea]